MARKRIALLGVALIALSVSACRPRVAAAPPPAPRVINCTIAADAVASQLLALTNSSRTQAGLSPLAWDGQLACLARDWSTQMSVSGSFQHRDLSAVIRDPAYSRWYTLGENILRANAAITPDGMHTAWMNSPGHRANILNPAFTRMGVGAYQSPGGTTYWTQLFTAP